MGSLGSAPDRALKPDATSARARPGWGRPEGCESALHGHKMATASAQESPRAASRRCRFCYPGTNIGMTTRSCERGCARFHVVLSF